MNLITEVKKTISIDQCLGEYFLHVGNSQRKGRHWLTSMIRSIVNSWWIMEAAIGKCCKLYPSLISETVFLALELTQICYLHYIYNKYKQFFLKPGNLQTDYPSPIHVKLKDYPHHLTKFQGMETSRIPILKLFTELKNPNFQSFS